MPGFDPNELIQFLSLLKSAFGLFFDSSTNRAFSASNFYIFLFNSIASELIAPPDEPPKNAGVAPEL